MERLLVATLLALLTINAGFINYLVVKELRKPLCVFDIQTFIDFLSSRDMDEKTADLLLSEAKGFIENLECKAVLIKGALITGDARDVTGEVIKYVKNLHSEATE
jgi:hypothetical protein